MAMPFTVMMFDFIQKIEAFLLPVWGWWERVLFVGRIRFRKRWWRGFKRKRYRFFSAL